MSWNHYPDYESKADKQARVARLIAQAQRRGQLLEPILPKKGRDLSTTFWGQAWNRNLMAYSDYESRLPRGRSYFRQGGVMDLEIEKGVVRSVVAGSDLYTVQITIAPLDNGRWMDLRNRCQGRVGSLLELLAGKLSAEVLRELTDLEHGLFPEPKEIRFSCTCPDWADLCKHCAATLYAVGTKLDDTPEHFFLLRGVEAEELTGGAMAAVDSLTAQGTQPAPRAAALAGADLSDLFGVELSGLEALLPLLPAPKKGSAIAAPQK